MSDIYSEIYSIASNNMNKSGSIGITKEAFSVWSNEEYDKIDMNNLYDLDNESFVEAAYLVFFDRAVDDEAKEIWSLRFHEDKESFQSDVIKTIMKSMEFKLNEVEVINNKYQLHNNQYINAIEKNKLFKVLLNKLYLVYHSTLRPVKVKIKKCLNGRKE